MDTSTFRLEMVLREPLTSTAIRNFLDTVDATMRDAHIEYRSYKSPSGDAVVRFEATGVSSVADKNTHPFHPVHPKFGNPTCRNGAPKLKENTDD